jgi:hypothetical protein
VEELWSGRRRRTRHRQEESTYGCALGYIAAGAGDPQRLYRRPDWTARARVTSGRQVYDVFQVEEGECRAYARQ